ncbi:MAG: aspartate carbamoyltransferase regulatory subunit [Candidatus Micrarchaeota archaeon]|nr:aspartate carbamoyltransferase regulatory subunit [Candidatus Micrarchaeota archaeon]
MPLTVQKIEEGTVIDHITAGAGTKVLQMLSSSYPISKMCALIINAPSRKLGKKDIVKIEGVFLEEKTVNKISLVAPQATVNIIRQGKVSGKQKVSLPPVLSGVVKCPNPKCITNLERAETCFLQMQDGQLRCKHCERVFKPSELA